jgi:peptidylprolyl isomerase
MQHLRVPILPIRNGTDVTVDLSGASPPARRPARYADARANRRDRFFVKPAGGVDACNVPVPIRRAP